MNILRWIFGEPSPKPTVDRMPSNSRRWTVCAPSELHRFFDAITALVPTKSVLYLENSYCDDITRFLDNNRWIGNDRVPADTFWPSPEPYYVEISNERMRGLSNLTKGHPDNRICSHIKIFHDKRMLLEWHDADGGNDFQISEDIPEEKVRAFCGQCNVRWGVPNNG